MATTNTNCTVLKTFSGNFGYDQKKMVITIFVDMTGRLFWGKGDRGFLVPEELLTNGVEAFLQNAKVLAETAEWTFLDYQADHYQFPNGNWWRYATCMGFNRIEYSIGGVRKVLSFSHGLWSSKEMDEYKVESFLEAAGQDCPLYREERLYHGIGKPHYYLTIAKGIPTGLSVDSQSAWLILKKEAIGFNDAENGIACNNYYKRFFSDVKVVKYY